MVNRARCRRCGAEIRWAETINGKNVPLNPVPEKKDGRWKFDMGKVRCLTGVEWERAQVRGDRLFVSHFETCTGIKRKCEVSAS